MSGKNLASERKKRKIPWKEEHVFAFFYISLIFELV